jgi:hypothetical protein
MRITFRLDPQETGLARVTAGPRGYTIKVDGADVGHLSRIRVKFQEWGGWYFYARLNGRYKNTSNSPVATLEEIKAAAKAWLLEK